MSDQYGHFVWYELLTVNIAAAKTFYGSVVGWNSSDASTSNVAYTVFTAGAVPVAGLMSLPEEGRQLGAAPRWVGYIAVANVDATAELIRRLGGAVYVPPTDSNIGRLAVVADPQTATFALIDSPKPAQGRLPALGEPGHVGWHELFAADGQKAFAFYGEVFGWHKPDAETGPMESYQLFAAGGQTMGGMFTKFAKAPVPFWLYYFTVGEIDPAIERVKAGGGQIFHGPVQLPGDSAIVWCIDPQGAIFALLGTRRGDAVRAPASLEIGWSTAWGDISSRGRLVTKPKG